MDSKTKISRLGEEKLNIKGSKMRIIEYLKYGNITVKFEDGNIYKHRTYSQFLKGNIINILGIPDRLNAETCNNDNEHMVIIEYFKSDNITVKFEDGNIYKNRTYDQFLKGSIINKLGRLNEVEYNISGYKMEIIKYEGSKNVTVKFENGCIAECTYCNFKNGLISNIIDRVGEENINTKGSKMVIIEYKNSSDITIRFENGYTVHNTYSCFKDGKISNPYDKVLHNVGYLGEGKYRSIINGIRTKQYKEWNSMLNRCYSKSLQERLPTYKGCTVCKEWLNFNIFCIWYDENYYEIEGKIMAIDKDILHKHNKIYSPETAIFVPNNINSLFVKGDARRGNTPIGTYLMNRDNIYVAQCKDNKGGVKYLGRYITKIEAFYAYKEFKEKTIKQVADEYKERIPKKLYDAMYKYTVEITD